MLLVLDHVEHVESGVDFVSKLLGRAPHIKLLVTAQTPLHASGERVLKLHGLRLPVTGDDTETAEASLLFLQEARRVALDFQLPYEERISLIRLCTMVGAHPLALVLAARWAPMLGCSGIIHEFESGLGLDILTTTDSDLPERHRSIKTILESAIALLPSNDRVLVQTLAGGGYGALPRHLLPRLRVLDEQALLQVDASASEVGLHPLLRLYIQRNARPVVGQAA
jgi:predicted ATPase